MDDEYIFKVNINYTHNEHGDSYSVVLEMDGFTNQEDAEHAATMLLNVLDGEEGLDLH